MPMSLLRRHIISLALGLAFVLPANAHAGLYGFDSFRKAPVPYHLEQPPRHIINYRKDMRDLVIALSTYGKSRIPGFVILPHEGQYLLNKSLWEYNLDGYNDIRRSKKHVDDPAFLSEDIPENAADETTDDKKYITAIDGIVVNNHYCHNAPLDSAVSDFKLPVFSIEQCDSDAELDKAIADSFKEHRVIYPFRDTEQAFRKVKHQLIINENADNITQTSQAKNISFLLNDEEFDERYQLVEKVRDSNYDIIVVRPLFHHQTPFTADEVYAMKFKKNGAQRLVLAAYNLSEISTEDSLWQKDWKQKIPDWIAGKSLSSGNSYITKYWTEEWKSIAGRRFKDLADTGYDGVFLTGVENHRYFEQKMPLE